MRRTRRTAAITVAVFLVLVAAVYFLEFRRPREENGSPYEPLWPDLTVGQVVRVTVEGELGLRCTVERDAQGQWQMVEPTVGPADGKRVQRLVEHWVEISTYRRFAPEEIDLEQFGLLTPKAMVTLGLSNGDSWTVALGEKSPKGNTYYAQWRGEVHLLPRGPVEEALGLLSTPPYPPTPTPEPTD
ncbi:MAG: DUF4340 domain-containing protein [Chloroflexia bacterium]